MYTRPKTCTPNALHTRLLCLDSCYDNEGSFASWLALKHSTQIAFYEESECQGKHITVNTSPRGKLKFADVSFDKKVSSFMLWKIGPYPIRGFLDICHGRENALLNSTYATGDESANAGCDGADVGSQFDSYLYQGLEQIGSNDADDDVSG
ncbi:unnamed protein product [Phytophthora lilii]|uniref:Unnamed protein product n=1 Tax=Phytophthora lilii TaxID=2077276 RepID=A0A9W6TP19_9STRA|nr:unnamed protein product [Phytophthora lilii]